MDIDNVYLLQGDEEHPEEEEAEAKVEEDLGDEEHPVEEEWLVSAHITLKSTACGAFAIAAKLCVGTRIWTSLFHNLAWQVIYADAPTMAPLTISCG